MSDDEDREPVWKSMPSNIGRVFERAEEEKRRTAQAESKSDMDEATRKLENIHDIIVDVGSRFVAPVPGMGVVVKDVVNSLEDFATLGLRHRDDEDKADE